MATGTYTTYTAQVTSGLYARIKIKNDNPDTVNNRTLVYYEADVYRGAGWAWYDLMNHTDFKITIDGQVVYSTATGNYDLRNSDSSPVKSGSIYVNHSEDGTKTFNFEFYVDATETKSGIYPASVKGAYQLPNIARVSDFTFSSSSVPLGTAVTVNIARGSTALTHKILYSFNGVETQLATGVATQASITIPASVASSFTNVQSFNIPIIVETYNGSALLGRKTNNLTLTLIAATYKPKLTSVTIQEQTASVSAAFTDNLNYLANLSTIKITANGLSLVGAASLYTYEYRVKEYPDWATRNSGNSITLGPFPFAISAKTALTLEVRAIDSRGFASDWVSSPTATLHPYTSPVLGSMAVFRGGSATDAIVNRNWSVKSITPGDASTEKNIANLRFLVREQGTTAWYGNTGATSTALSGVNSQAVLSGTFLGNKNYEIKAVLSDKFNTVESAIMVLPTEQLPISFYKDKISIGEIVDKASAFTLNVSTGGVKSKGQVQINKNDNALQLKGDTRIFQEFFKAGVRKGYLGFPSAGSDFFYIANEAVSKTLELGTLARYGGEVLLTNSTLSPTLSMLNGGVVMVHADVNANNYTTSLMVWVWETAPGKLVNFPTNMGLLWNINVNGTQLYQIFFPANTSLPIKRRERNNSGVWSAWA
ncbi:DUF859 family phage minor structural protein [Vaginisenegalia massiliensis]|uniref:DUF859 family phage minor structural protein n=1 Tax=Vaginisenegalia massiliensis TaxID=2058294 RepID=UPI0013DE3020|nr:DUF859 family phage minor structural protein [Vaginisenegalia massiliensis]